jgi:hypothetical protein
MRLCLLGEGEQEKRREKSHAPVKIANGRAVQAGYQQAAPQNGTESDIPGRALSREPPGAGKAAGRTPYNTCCLLDRP